MGILSATTALTRYRVLGELADPVIDTISEGLKQHTIQEIDAESEAVASGWTSIDSPYKPDFEGSSFLIGSYIVVALRIDKKSIPTKIVKKHLTQAMAQILAESKRPYLSKAEKSDLKDHVISQLNRQIPATPNMYDLIWDYENQQAWFLSNLKSANEELETLFATSFGVRLVRQIPYTQVEFSKVLNPDERDRIAHLTPTVFAS